MVLIFAVNDPQAFPRQNNGRPAAAAAERPLCSAVCGIMPRRIT
jgi:hypothetical protein